MSIHVHSKDFHSSSTVPLAESETWRMQRFFSRLINVRWMMLADHGEVVVRCDVNARSGHFFGAARCADLAAAVRGAADHVIRQRRRKKRMTRRSSARQAVLS